MPKGIQRGDQALALSRFYRLHGRLPLMLDETIVPVHLVGDLREDIDREAGFLFGGPVSGAAAAPLVGIENPADSGVLVEIHTYATVEGVNPSRLWIEPEILGALAIGASSATVWRDSRQTGIPQARAVASEATPPPPLEGPLAQGNFAGDFLTNRPTIILRPNSRFWIEEDALNTDLQAWFAWRERLVEASEL